MPKATYVHVSSCYSRLTLRAFGQRKRPPFAQNYYYCHYYAEMVNILLKHSLIVTLISSKIERFAAS